MKPKIQTNKIRSDVKQCEIDIQKIARSSILNNQAHFEKRDHNFLINYGTFLSSLSIQIISIITGFNDKENKILNEKTDIFLKQNRNHKHKTFS